MLDYFLSDDSIISFCLKIAFWRDNVKILPSFTQSYNG